MYEYEKDTLKNNTGNNTDLAEIPGRHRRRRRRKRTGRHLKKAMAVVFSAVLFGSTAAGTFYGTGRLLTASGEVSGAETVQAAVTDMSYSLEQMSSGQSLDVTDIAAKGLPSVVSVTNISVQEVYNYFGRFGRNSQGPVQMQETVSCGSGIIIYADDTSLYMVTNYHVVEGATTLSVTFADDTTYEAQLCGSDEENDLAVLKVAISELSGDTLSKISVVAIGNSDELVIGEQVVAIGNALGYGQSVTTGIVSAVNRTISDGTSSQTYIQTDAAINPGNSGGALLNMEGELIGINTAKISSEGVEGMGYAIPISEVLDLIGSLMNE